MVDKLTFYKRDTKSLTFALKRDNAAIDLTGGKVPWFSAKEKVGDSSYIFNKEMTRTASSEGLAQVTLASTDLATEYKDATGEVVLVTSSNGNQETLDQFAIEILQDVKTTQN